MTTNYMITTTRIGVQPINVTSTVQNHPVGTIVTAEDSVLGEGEFIYLPGLTGTAVGSVVVFDTNADTTTLIVHTSVGAVGVAMSANVGSQYGWYQINGSNLSVLATGGTANKKVYTTSTAGSVSTTIVSGDGIEGMTCTVAVSGGVIGVQLERPSANFNG